MKKRILWLITHARRLHARIFRPLRRPKQNPISIQTVLSLASRGARYQFEIAVVLISIIPLLTLTYLFHQSRGGSALSAPAMFAVGAILVTIVVLGYALLLKYPRTILRLRKDLKQIAKGEIPDTVVLAEAEDDITAIKDWLNLIIAQMKERIRTIERQHQQLLRAERERVMTESLGAACHHLGQPATVIISCLELMKHRNVPVELQDLLDESIAQAQAMEKTFKRLLMIREYCTEPYISKTDENGQRYTKKILSLHKKPGVSGSDTSIGVEPR